MPPSPLQRPISYKRRRTLRRRERAKQAVVHIPCLAEFIQQSWQVLEPGAELVWNWHIDAMCLHAEVLLIGWMRSQSDLDWRATLNTLLAWLREQSPELQATVPVLEEWAASDRPQLYQNLLINVPPGSLKSRTISVCLPAWMWLHAPRWRSMFLSSNPRVAMRDALLCRDLLESDWYATTFRPQWQLRTDQSAKSNYWNTAGGMRFAFGITAKITGDRADALFVDDPHDAEEVKSSDAQRLEVLERWDNAISNRVNDLRCSVRLGIMQRLHTADWSGHVLANEEWEHLSIEQEFEAAKKRSSLGWKDPRQVAGELMFPARFPMEALLKEKRRGSYYYSGQHQQRPTPLSGGVIKRAWVKRYSVPLHRYELIVQSWDTANKKGATTCPWAGLTFGIHGGMADLLDVHTERYDYPDGKRSVESLFLKHRPDVLLIEDKSTGSSLIQEFRLHGIPNPNGGKLWANIMPMDPDADKVTRMVTEAIALESGRVRFPETAPWLPDFEGIVFNFPNAPINDPVDALSQFLKWWRGRDGLGTLPTAPNVPSGNPYEDVAGSNPFE